MAQQVKKDVVRTPDHPSVNPGAYMTDGQNDCHKLSTDLHTYAMTGARGCAPHDTCNFKKLLFKKEKRAHLLSLSLQKGNRRVSSLSNPTPYISHTPEQWLSYLILKASRPHLVGRYGGLNENGPRRLG